MMRKIDQAHVSGRVLAEGGTVKIGTVELHNRTDDIMDTILVDPQGHYSFHLTPGKWKLRAWDVHGRRGEVTVELRSGADAAVDIELEP
ncbi:MAG: DUF1416 domain-containing protein [Actinobacteria bacterium]|nr:DUF1416 domain-containing protein [Actinomycetota bacterium]